MRIDGLILAGGASRRMGRDKALVEVDGRPMIEIVLATLQQAVSRVVVAGRDRPVTGVPAVPDPPGERFRGPLAGLVAGLGASDASHILAVAVDQPWVRAATLTRLVERAGRLPVVPVVGGIRQTTCAVYPTAILRPATEELEAGGSIQSLLDRTAFDPVVEEEWLSWGEDGRSWFSADTPEALEVGLIRFGSP